MSIEVVAIQDGHKILIMKFIIILFLFFSNLCFAQNREFTAAEAAGVCQGHHIFWSALSARNGKKLNMQCSFENIKKLEQIYGNNPDFKKLSSNTNSVLIEAFKRNDPSVGRYTASVCNQIQISPCFLE